MKTIEGKNTLEEGATTIKINNSVFRIKRQYQSGDKTFSELLLHIALLRMKENERTDNY